MTPNSKGEILPTAPRWAKNKENLRMGGDVRTVMLKEYGGRRSYNGKRA